MGKATLRLGEVLDSNVVVGLGERNLPPGQVREWVHHGGLQGGRSVLVNQPTFKKIFSQPKIGSCRGA